MRDIVAILGLIFALAAAAGAEPRADAASGGPWIGGSPFADPGWRNSFLGSYGFLSGAEPEVDRTELELLREVIEVMRADPRAAVAMLEPRVGASSSAALDFILANLQFQAGDLDAARKHYRSALDKFPDFRRAHKNIGLLLVQGGDCQGALVHLSRAAELGDRDGRNFGLMGFCHVDQENFLAAEAAYRTAVLQEPDTRDWKLGLARSLLALEHYKDAAAIFDTLLAADPEDPTLWMLQANAYVGLDRPLDAAVNLEAVRMLGKAQTGSLVLLGDIYMNEQMYDLAKGAYLAAIENDGEGAGFDAAYRAADLLVRARSFVQADEILASVDARYPKLSGDDELKVLTLKAKSARGQGRDAKAAALLDSIVTRDGTRGDALLELASYHEDRGDVEKALFLIERAEKLDAFEYQALLAHAQLEVSQRDYAKAAGLLRRALEIRHEPRVEAFLTRIEAARRG